MTVKRPPPIVPTTGRRDILIALGCGAVVLAFIVYGVFSLGSNMHQSSPNQLSGIILAKHASGEREKEITLGRKGLQSQEVDSGFSFDVRVGDRTYEVPVTKATFDRKKVGERQDFIRPPSEQK